MDSSHGSTLALFPLDLTCQPLPIYPVSLVFPANGSQNQLYDTKEWCRHHTQT